MLDTCTVVRVTGRSTNTTTGIVTPTTASLYSGACRYRAGNQSQTGEAGAHAFTLVPAEVHVPVGAFVPAVGDKVTITASATDAGNVGRVLTVTARPSGAQTSALRIPVEEVTG